ncbi:uncharacterized protein [Drosophila takahashii]|uniref:uncharacterized protein n=1 Tax=Drosophila takahashii TaxID=29030 RepID=UPI003899267F
MTAQSFGHSSIGQSMINKTDNMTPRTFPEVKTTSFMGPDDWKTGRDQSQHLNIYTDGFKMEGGVGAGVYCTDPAKRLSFKLPNDCSIFQAEVFTIRKAAEVVQNINRPHDVVNLVVDSQAAIKSMKSSTGIDGNETADVLAKEGAELANDRTCLFPSERSKAPWRNRRTREQKAGGGIPRPAESQELCAKSATTNSASHCLAASHATTLGILNSRACRKCNESGAIETLEHLICNCPTLSRARRRYLGAPVLASLGDASSKEPGELLAIAKNTSILMDIKTS